jgi:hypothetical protein
MKEIFTSASKIVLLYLVLILGILALFAGAHAVWTGQFNDAEKAILASFGGAITFVFGFYFNSKGDPSLPNAGK